MNKKYFSLSLIVLAVVFAGCTKPAAQNSPEPGVEQNVSDQPVRKEVITNQQRIAQAMANGTSVKCEMVKRDTNDTIVFEMKGTKSKASGAALSGGKGTGYMVNDGESVYIWNDADKKGVKMSLAAMPSGSAQQYQDFTKEEVEKSYQDLGYTYTCDEGVVADNSFVVPRDVTFTDMDAMMDSVKQMQGGSMSAEDQKKMMEEMKKYQDQ